MRLLLDSNVLLWAVYAPEKLTGRVSYAIQDSTNELLVSHASLWELLGKIGRGKLLLAGSSVDAAMQRFTVLGAEFLPVELDHILAAAHLPNHHSDPFDRVIIAQALDKTMPVLTSDTMFQNYGVDVIW